MQSTTVLVAAFGSHQAAALPMHKAMDGRRVTLPTWQSLGLGARDRRCR